MNQPESPKPAIRSVLIALMLAIFLGALDQTIVAVSMPAISAQFKDVSLLAWVISGYMVAMTVAVPIYGKLGDLYGRRKLMLFGMGLFTLASLLCGLAQSMEQLVLARIIQGIGAGGMISVSQAIIGDIVPPRERGRYQGYFSSMYAVASVAGPVLGGFMTEYLSWRWVFLINLPLGLGAWLVASEMNRNGRQPLPEQAARVLLAREMQPTKRRPGSTEVYFERQGDATPQRLFVEDAPVAAFAPGSIARLHAHAGRWWGQWGRLESRLELPRPPVSAPAGRAPGG